MKILQKHIDTLERQNDTKWLHFSFHVSRTIPLYRSRIICPRRCCFCGISTI